MAAGFRRAMPIIKLVMLKYLPANNSILTALLLLLTAASLHAAPVEFREICFMLKHGISSAELASDVKTRKLVGTPTDEQVAQLKGLGASKELIEAVTAPANALGDKGSEAYLREKEIAAEEHFWVIGAVMSVKDGVMLVSCPDVHLKKGALAQCLGFVQIQGKLPSVFKQNEAQEVWFVNCEVRKTGTSKMMNQANEPLDVPVAEVVQDFGKPQAPVKSQASAPVELPKRHEMVMDEGTWYHMSDPKSVPGGGPNAWIRLVGTDQFHVVLQITEKGPSLLAPKSEYQIKKGADGSGDNLTLVCSDGQWRVFWKDAVAFPGTGVFVFDHK
jgi:hypothetical protein